MRIRVIASDSLRGRVGDRAHRRSPAVQVTVVNRSGLNRRRFDCCMLNLRPENVQGVGGYDFSNRASQDFKFSIICDFYRQKGRSSLPRLGPHAIVEHDRQWAGNNFHPRHTWRCTFL